MTQDDRMEPFLGTVASEGPRSDTTTEQVLADLKKLAREIEIQPCPVANLPPFFPRQVPFIMASPPYAERASERLFYAGGGLLHSRTHGMLLAMDLGTEPDRTRVALLQARNHNGNLPGALGAPPRWRVLHLRHRRREVAVPRVTGWRAQLLGALVSIQMLRGR